MTPRQAGWLAIVAVSGALGCAGTNPRATQTGDAAAGSGATSGGGGRDGAIDVTSSVDITVADGRVIGSDALGDAACATATQKAQQVPLDIYIMMDSSGSMDDVIDTNSTTTKWAAVRDAIIAFLRDSQSAGLGVGIQYFPLTQPGVPGTCEMNNACNAYGPCDILNTCSATPTITPCQTNADCRGGQGTCVRLGVCNLSGGACAPAGTQYLCTANNANDFCAPIAGYCDMRDRCDAASYATPAVEVAALPGAANALVTSLNGHMPDGLTPTAGALSGAVMHAQALARANPTHKVVVLLATDGLPSECNPSDIAGVAAIASTALAATPSIATYVIGVFAPAEMADAQTNLNALAAAGGTGSAFLISTGNANVTTAFVSALNSVRSSGLSCQYTVPTPTATGDGGQIDYYTVNVQFTSGSGQATTIGNVKDRASCSATKGGWYYDVDPSTGATPQTISICDTSCAQMKADPGGRIDILLGCQTVIIVD
ncbi:MAG TPA: hypothetical protein VKQ32_24880 [Polyangia bacterium]|nr:hypothetical protein [Polyangia bacterium]